MIHCKRLWYCLPSRQLFEVSTTTIKSSRSGEMDSMIWDEKRKLLQHYVPAGEGSRTTISTICLNSVGHCFIGPNGDFSQSTSKMNLWKGVIFSGRGSEIQSKIFLFGLFFRARATSLPSMFAFGVSEP
jgi:hypothetical protein